MNRERLYLRNRKAKGYTLVEMLFVIGLVPIALLVIFESTRSFTKHSLLTKGEATFYGEMAFVSKLLTEDLTCSSMLANQLVTTDLASIQPVSIPRSNGTRQYFSTNIAAGVRVSNSIEYTSVAIIREAAASFFSNLYRLQIKASPIIDGKLQEPGFTKEFTILGIQSNPSPPAIPRLLACGRPTSPISDCISSSGTMLCNQEGISKGGILTEAVASYFCSALVPNQICTWRTTADGVDGDWLP